MCWGKEIGGVIEIWQFAFFDHTRIREQFVSTLLFPDFGSIRHPKYDFYVFSSVLFLFINCFIYIIEDY